MYLHNCLMMNLPSQSVLRARGVRVVVVTFGEAEGAEKWRQDTNCPFLYVRNPDLSLYSALGFKRFSTSYKHS